MLQTDAIVVTGAAGFIGSVLVSKLNELGFHNLILVDDFSRTDKVRNLLGKKFSIKVHRDQLFDWLQNHPNQVQHVFHLGARTDTTLTDPLVFQHLNIDFTQKLFSYCAAHAIPIVYASSAATYGAGAQGYNDNEAEIGSLQPLNEYARSKDEIDIWILDQKKRPPFWAGFKFFNVYGPNEGHKGRMASVVFHAYKQVLKNGIVKLFKSHNPEYEDGGQMRDFIYVKDVVDVLVWAMEQHPHSGIYNLGTGTPRSFYDLVQALLHSLQHSAKIEYIPTPESIRENYQYYTAANMDKLRHAGYTKEFTSIEDGVADYAQKYLEAGANI